MNNYFLKQNNENLSPSCNIENVQTKADVEMVDLILQR